MSRSYKHTPYSGDRKNKFVKRYFNKRLRRIKLKHNLKYNLYKKYSCSWEICDYYHIETKNFEKYYQSCIDNWYKNQSRWYMPKDHFPIKAECWKEYQKWYIRK